MHVDISCRFYGLDPLYVVCPLCLKPNIARRKIDRMPPVTPTGSTNEHCHDPNNNNSTTLVPSDGAFVTAFHGHDELLPVQNNIQPHERQDASPGRSPQSRENTTQRTPPSRVVRGIIAHHHPDAA